MTANFLNIQKNLGNIVLNLNGNSQTNPKIAVGFFQNNIDFFRKRGVTTENDFAVVLENIIISFQEKTVIIFTDAFHYDSLNASAHAYAVSAKIDDRLSDFFSSEDIKSIGKTTLCHLFIKKQNSITDSKLKTLKENLQIAMLARPEFNSQISHELGDKSIALIADSYDNANGSSFFIVTRTALNTPKINDPKVFDATPNEQIIGKSIKELKKFLTETIERSLNLNSESDFDIHCLTYRLSIYATKVYLNEATDNPFADVVKGNFEEHYWICKDCSFPDIDRNSRYGDNKNSVHINFKIDPTRGSLGLFEKVKIPNQQFSESNIFERLKQPVSKDGLRSLTTPRISLPNRDLLESIPVVPTLMETTFTTDFDKTATKMINFMNMKEYAKKVGIVDGKYLHVHEALIYCPFMPKHRRVEDKDDPRYLIHQSIEKNERFVVKYESADALIEDIVKLKESGKYPDEVDMKNLTLTVNLICYEKLNPTKYVGFETACHFKKKR